MKNIKYIFKKKERNRLYAKIIVGSGLDVVAKIADAAFKIKLNLGSISQIY